jgi:hypothetical protein
MSFNVEKERSAIRLLNLDDCNLSERIASFIKKSSLEECLVIMTKYRNSYGCSGDSEHYLGLIFEAKVYDSEEPHDWVIERSYIPLEVDHVLELEEIQDIMQLLRES